MSDDEHFIARWSRRKRRAAAAAPPPREEAAPGEHGQSDTAPGEPLPVPDAPDLPPIDSIGADTDIRAFLAGNVPAGLTRAALRRAWSADPAIRDFIGLSENSWDFNAPDGVPGFGSITAADARRLLEQMLAPPDASAMAEPEPTDATAPTATPALADRPAVADTAMQDAAAPAPDVGGRDKIGAGPEDDAATQHEVAAQDRPVPRRRGHGGALPE